MVGAAGLMSFFCPCIMAGQIGEKIGSCSFLAVVAIFIILLMGDIFGELLALPCPRAGACCDADAAAAACVLCAVIGTAGFTTCVLEYLFLVFVVARLRGDMKLQFNLQVSAP